MLIRMNVCLREKYDHRYTLCSKCNCCRHSLHKSSYPQMLSMIFPQCLLHQLFGRDTCELLLRFRGCVRCVSSQVVDVVAHWGFHSTWKISKATAVGCFGGLSNQTQESLPLQHSDVGQPVIATPVVDLVDDGKQALGEHSYQHSTTVANEMATARPHYNKQRTTRLRTRLNDFWPMLTHNYLGRRPRLLLRISFHQSNTTHPCKRKWKLCLENVFGRWGSFSKLFGQQAQNLIPLQNIMATPLADAVDQFAKCIDSSGHTTSYDILPFVSWLLHTEKMWSASRHAESHNPWVGGPRRIRKRPRTVHHTTTTKRVLPILLWRLLWRLLPIHCHQRHKNESPFQLCYRQKPI